MTSHRKTCCAIECWKEFISHACSSQGSRLAVNGNTRLTFCLQFDPFTFRSSSVLALDIQSYVTYKGDDGNTAIAMALHVSMLIENVCILYVVYV